MPWSKDPSRYSPELLHAAVEYYRRLTGGEGEIIAVRADRGRIMTLRQHFYAIAEAYLDWAAKAQEAAGKGAPEVETPPGVKEIKKMVWRVAPGDPTELKVSLPMMPLVLQASKDYQERVGAELLERLRHAPTVETRVPGHGALAVAQDPDQLMDRMNRQMEELLKGPKEKPDGK